MKVYKHIKTDEVVYEEEAEDYVLDQLGLKIEPKGKYGAYTQDQSEFLVEFVEWFFSGNWIKEEREVS
jgi:hypothetical protein